jgi:hypothetical protein
MIKKLYLQTHVTALCTAEPRFLLEGLYKINLKIVAVSNNLKFINCRLRRLY